MTFEARYPCRPRGLRPELWSAAASALLATFSLGCIEPFKTPAEYDSQRYLCSDEHQDAWAEVVASCASAAACGGVVSFDGQLEGAPVTVESRQSSTVFRRISRAETGEVFLDRVDSFGTSPYFEFGLQMKSVGGDAEEDASAPREMVVDRAAGNLPNGIEDNIVQIDLRLTSGGESGDLFGLKGGKVIISSQSSSEISGSFDSSFGTEADRLEGCFTLFPTTVNTSQE